MTINPLFLKSRVAHRIVLLFIICALVPMAIFATISFIQVNSQLDKNAQNRLHEKTVTESFSVLSRMNIVNAEMELIVARLNMGTDFPDLMKKERWHKSLLLHYDSLNFVSLNTGRTKPVLGDRRIKAEFSNIQKKQLGSGDTILMVLHHELKPSIFIVKPLDKDKKPGSALMGEIKPEYLLGIDEDYMEYITINKSIIDNNLIIFSTLPRNYGNDLLKGMPSPQFMSRSFPWSHENKEFISSSTPVFLKNILEAPAWTLVLSESQDSIHSPMGSFMYTFILVFFTAIFTVLLLSINQIHKNMIPLERLKQGTKDLSNGDFSSRVEVKSGDEFEDLANSFNAMADTIDNQFRILKTMTSIDQTILSALDAENIVDTFIARINDIFPCDSVSICLSNRNPDESWQVYTKDIANPDKKIMRTIKIPMEKFGQLSTNREYLILDHEQALPVYLEDLSSQKMQSYLLMPIFYMEKISAVITLANRHQQDFNGDLILQARHIVNRMAVALSNAILIEDLNKFNLGTMTALARAVDAKSPWTAGHSERVADIAVRIGRVMGLSIQDVETLNKAGLLHDVGKISTPRSILDKKGKLTDEEFSIIKEHPEQGVRILEPIDLYRDILPMVLQHHERYDGKGYPHGISGEDLTLSARILCVADAFDAMVSDRPYRKGMGLKKVLEEMKKEAGQQFDPDVVKALLKIKEEETIEEECE